jgi:hypothetical protein
MAIAVGIGRRCAHDQRNEDSTMRTLRACVVMATAGLLLGGAGCDEPGFSSCARGGIALLSWSVRGQPPTADQGCKGVHHVVAELSSVCNEVEIAPIPCISGERWRYDGLPGGTNLVTLLAIDARMAIIARGSTTVALDRSVPDAPTPIDLQ